MATLIFGGTKEGRVLAETLSEHKENIHVCVATEYGKSLLAGLPNVTIHEGRLDEEAMKQLLVSEQIDECLDATHPYATEVTKNIKSACDATDVPYIRILRNDAIGLHNGCNGDDSNCDNIDDDNNSSIDCNCDSDNGSQIIYVDSVDEAVSFLSETEGNIFITTGSKELHKYTKIPQYKERCFARVLSTFEVVENCKKIGFEGKNLFCMQGPFSEELNYAMLLQTKASYLVTKNSGVTGGFYEKCEAAIRANCTLVVIGRPEEDLTQAISFKEYMKALAKNEIGNCECDEHKKAYIIGIGCGNPKQMSVQAIEALMDSDCIIGAKRMVDSCMEAIRKVSDDNFVDCANKVNVRKKGIELDNEKTDGINSFISYMPDEIEDFLKAHGEYKTVSFVFSGDIGFYSGAKKMEQILSDFDIERIPGIASPVYLCDKIGMPWEEVAFVSNHGTTVDITKILKEHKSVCTLLGKKSDVSDFCKVLCENQLESVKVVVGERLSYKDEKLTSASAKDFIGKEFDPLSVALFIV